MFKQRYLIGLVLFVIVITGIWLLSSSRVKNTNEVIKIGVILPLSGDAASYGHTEQNVIDMAFSEINESGGINGQKLVAIYEDGGCNGKDAASAASKLINIDKVKIILGGMCSGETLAIAPIAEENRVILFASYSSSPLITTSGDFIFRNCVSDAQGGPDIAEAMFKDGHRKAAILSENTDYAQSLKKIFRENFERLGGEVVADETYMAESKDFRSSLIKFKNAHPDAIFYNPQVGLTGGLSVKQASDIGLRLPAYGNYAFGTTDALTAGKNSLNGLKFSDLPGLSKDNTKAVEFLTKYTAKFSTPASDYEAGARYDSIYILKFALEDCGGIDTNCIKSRLYSMSNYNGTIGKYKFDHNGDIEGIKFNIKKVIDAEKGEIIIL